MEWYWETQKKSQKRELGEDKWYNQMGQVGYVGQVGQGEGGLQILVGQVRKWDKEKGVFRSSWDKWDKDKGSVHLTHSTCPKWDYEAVDFSSF